MLETETAGMMTCERTTIKVPAIDMEVESVHAIYFLNKEGQAIIKTIEALPYIFQIHDDPKSIRQTRISKLIKGYKYGDNVSMITFGEQRINCEQLIVVPSVVNIQWDNPEAVKERVQMYMLFS